MITTVTQSDFPNQFVQASRETKALTTVEQVAFRALQFVVLVAALYAGTLLGGVIGSALPFLGTGLGAAFGGALAFTVALTLLDQLYKYLEHRAQERYLAAHPQAPKVEESVA